MYSQGISEQTEIRVEKQTGVNYLFHQHGYSGGLTPLLKSDGIPVVTPVSKCEL